MRVYSDPASERHFNELARVEAPERFPAALAGVDAAEKAGLPVERRSCKLAPENAVLAVHDQGYVEKLREMSAADGGYLSLDTAFGAGSFEVAMLASGAACSAVESALSGESAFAIARPPGHHAGRDYGMGFCLLNHVAVAAANARSLGAERVAILDWDVHHGNGTQDIFYADPMTLYLSVHQSPFYPGTGAIWEVGEGDGRGFTANAPLPAGSGEDVYAAAFTGVFEPVLREYRPDCLIVSAGFDAHADDLLGGMRLETESFGRFAAALVALVKEIGAPPPAFVMEGGYDLGALTDSVAATIIGVERSAPPRWGYPGGVKQIEQSREELAPFWRSLR
ncbi:MAG: histone deacetylase [Rubrobacter sp.]|nr:histone deacetylase [Rubrobacter sp.]